MRAEIIAVPGRPGWRREQNEPRFDGNVVRAQHGGGVYSTIAVDATYFIAVYVEVYGNRYPDRFWRYYLHGKKVAWKQLSDAERYTVLQARKENPRLVLSPRPGKLRSQYLKRGELTTARRLEDGRFLGYKYLYKAADDPTYYSPMAFNVRHRLIKDSWRWAWKDRALTADLVPTRANSHGIYAVKSYKDPELARYRWDDAHGPFGIVYIPHLVELALSGHVIETERGFRAEMAEIMRIINYDPI